MKAHDLARALLAGPDVPVTTAYDDVPEHATPISNVKIEDRLDPDANGLTTAKVVVLYFSNSGDLWASV